MIRISFLFTLLLFSAFSCADEEIEPENQLEGHPAPITKVEAPATVSLGKTLPIKVYFVVNNGCGTFKAFDVDQRSDATYIKVFPKYVNQFCHQALVTLEVVYEFKPAKTGTHTLKFLSELPDVYITKVIEVTPSER
jgi:hypothetical protein